MTMYANQRWPFQQQANSNTYGGCGNGPGNSDDDDGDASAIVADGFCDFATSFQDGRYPTVRPKQWCTSYVDADRQRYIHSTTTTDSIHNGGLGASDSDVYGRTTADFFRSKTMPRARVATGVMADAYDDRAVDDDPRRWPAAAAASTSATDIVVYGSSTARYPFARPQNRQQQPAGQFQQAPVDADGKTAGPGPDRPAPWSKWKARALYAFLACLLAVVVVNLALTLWFIRVTQFTSEGMGSMKIVQGGLKLSGRTLITDRLVASAIRSRAGRPILIESTANITLSARNSQGRLVNSLKLTKDGLECAQASVFRVTDTRGEILFSADRSKVIVGAQELRVTGSGGAVFQGSVQTPMVRADPRHDLRMESASRRLELSGPQGVTIESRAGDISVSCLMDVKLESIAGAIQIDAAKVFFRGLKTAKTSNGGQSATGAPAEDGGRWSAGLHNSVSGPAAQKRGVEDRLPSVYQLCVCGNGKVFMSPPDGQCAADNESLVCR